MQKTKFVEPYFRFGHRHKLFINFSYNNTLFHDTLPLLNDDFLNVQGSRFQYFALSAVYKNDFRDEQNYPLSGHYFELMLEKMKDTEMDEIKKLDNVVFAVEE